MDRLNLRIEDYNQAELEDMFCLNYPYQCNDVQSSVNNLRNRLLSDKDVNILTKQNIESFLETASTKLESIIEKGIRNSKRVKRFSDSQNTVYNEGNNFLIENKALVEQASTFKEFDKLNIGKHGGAPPGIINPISYSTIKRALNIDSRFRPNYYNTSSSDQKLTLPCKFENVINMRLASIELPLTYYAISKSYGNNTMFISWDYDNNTGPNNIVKITIPDGNYATNINLNSGASSIESIINAGLQDENQYVIKGKNIHADASFNLRYTVDNTSGRSIFAYDPSGIDLSAISTQTDWKDGNLIRYNLTFGVTPTTADAEFISGNISYEPLPFFLGWQLGYRTNIYDSGKAYISGGTVQIPAASVSEGICYIKGPQYLFLSIDDYNNNVNNYFVSAYTDSINNKNILARINLSATHQRNGVYQSGEDDGFSTQLNRSRTYFGPVNIEKLRITLYDEYGRLINLNNMDWSCALMFEQVYEGGNIAY
jgi:hypothetical protein